MRAGRQTAYGPPAEDVVSMCVCARPRVVEDSCIYCGKPAESPVVATPAELEARLQRRTDLVCPAEVPAYLAEARG